MHKDETEAAKLQVKPKREVSWSQFLSRFGWPIFGCASTWFLLDIAFYSQASGDSRLDCAAGLARMRLLLSVLLSAHTNLLHMSG